jgi:asparagine synthase (glutamine-hydrolysing)
MPERSLIEMRDTMVHRGPDDGGTHLGPGVALGSRRLSIIDLSERGHMPMSTPDGRYWLAYNGEVYNFRELRRSLEARGVQFRSQTDTEVVLHSLVLDGVAALERFNGMFAIALWDAHTRSLLLGRDRLGIKPLYYAQAGSRLYFASEEKALFAAGVPQHFDSSVWEELFLFRFVAGERTPYGGVKRLLPGHVLRLDEKGMRVERWWNLADRARSLAGRLPSDAEGWYRSTFDDAIALRRISDVPVGVMLSGGLDSSAVAASLASQAGRGIESFTVRFPEKGYDEGPVARSVVDRFGLIHHDIRVEPRELFDMLVAASRMFDQPLVHGNDAHMLALSQVAKREVTVLLSGEGADETLSGYIRYLPLRYPPRAARLSLACAPAETGRARPARAARPEVAQVPGDAVARRLRALQRVRRAADRLGRAWSRGLRSVRISPQRPR